MDRFGFQNPILFFRAFFFENKIVFHLKGAGDENVECLHIFTTWGVQFRKLNFILPTT